MATIENDGHECQAAPDECDETAASSCEALVDESFLLRVLRGLIDRHILPSEADKAGSNEAHSTVEERNSSDDEDFERCMESLWDLCVDPSTAAFVACHRGLAALAGAVERSRGEGRIAEICLGTLANICSHRSVTEALPVADVAELAAATLRALSSSDGLSVLQALRLACALLCGPAASSCSELLQEAAVERYLFSLQHSLRWEVVQHACNALSQGLVLEARSDEGDQSSAATDANTPSFSSRLGRAKLPAVLTARAKELASAAAGDESAEHSADGDAELALLSALCLAESFITVAACSPSDIAPFGDAALLAVVRSDRPDVLAAAFQLISTLGQALIPEAVATSNDPAGTPAAESAMTEESRALQTKLQKFATSSCGIGEKFVLLLAETDQDIASVASVALVILQHAPSAEVADNHDDLARALAAALEEDEEVFNDSSTALGCISQRFMDWLRKPPEEEMQ